jgi:hypothetical protein
VAFVGQFEEADPDLPDLVKAQGPRPLVAMTSHLARNDAPLRARTPRVGSDEAASPILNLSRRHPRLTSELSG